LTFDYRNMNQSSKARKNFNAALNIFYETKQS
jgi:hypothetical protein